jgi:hypothetical protein
MALTKLTADMQNVSKLSNYPAEAPAQLKERFDKAGADIKNYINNTLTPELDTLLALAGAYPGAEVEKVINFLSQSRQNILHNWDFRNPVNQRRQLMYTANGYSIDRWKLEMAGMSYLSVDSDNKCVTLNKVNGYISINQLLETPASYNGEVMTLTVVYSSSTPAYLWITKNGDASSADSPVFIILPASLEYTTATVTGSYTTIDTSLKFRVGIMGATANGCISIKTVKLEKGTASTLAYDPPADYGEQLSLCQRFLKDLAGIYRAAFVTPDYITFAAGSILSSMRIPSPTITTPGSDWGVYSVNGGALLTGFTLEAALFGGIKAIKTAHSLSDALLTISPGKVLASADL